MGSEARYPKLYYVSVPLYWFHCRTQSRKAVMRWHILWHLIWVFTIWVKVSQVKKWLEMLYDLFLHDNFVVKHMCHIIMKRYFSTFIQINVHYQFVEAITCGYILHKICLVYSTVIAQNVNLANMSLLCSAKLMRGIYTTALCKQPCLKKC